jgi:nucleotide-binding universal stress UspA family protein
MKAIAVGYDGSAASKRALERAAELAEAFKAKLLVISVAELIPAASDPAFPGDAMGLASATTTAVPDEAEAKRELHDARSILSGRSVQVDYVEVVGDPADGIVDEAEARGADLIVVGTRHPGFLERIFGGDVGEAVSRRASRDVLIVH